MPGSGRFGGQRGRRGGVVVADFLLKVYTHRPTRLDLFVLHYSFQIS